jgi:hypothetical protein
MLNSRRPGFPRLGGLLSLFHQGLRHDHGTTNVPTLQGVLQVDEQIQERVSCTAIGAHHRVAPSATRV